jgi:hypothetical protein
MMVPGQRKERTMSVMLVDGISAVSLHNGVLRVDCVEVGPNNKQRSSGTLLIPGAQVAAVVNTLAQAAQEIDKRLREQQAAAAKPVGHA